MGGTMSHGHGRKLRTRIVGMCTDGTTALARSPSETGEVSRRVHPPCSLDILLRCTAPIAAILLGSSPALAEPNPGDRRAAEALFAEAYRLVDAGSWGAGCPKFEASFAFYASASTMINIARCHDHHGKIATAWQDYRRALALASETRDERRRGLLEIAQRGVEDLTPRLPKLRIVIREAPVGLELVCDGKVVSSEALADALPADPGPHEVRASAPGYRGQTLSVTLEEGKTATLTLTLTLAPTPAEPAAKSPSRGFFLPAGIALLATGALGIGIGAGTGIVSLNKISDVKQRCGGASCLPTDSDSMAMVASAKTLGAWSTASFAVGGALSVAGAVLLLVHPSGKSSSAADTASVGVSIAPGRATLQGTF
jgi:hypothetical protein